MKKVKPVRIINCLAFPRICDLGGWTDTWFAVYGCVLNFGVWPAAEVQIKVCEQPFREESIVRERVTIYAENFGERYIFDPDRATVDRHPLLEAAINMIGVPEEVKLEINLFSEMPAGASTGTSAAITVALIGALAKLTSRQLTQYEVALLAQQVETEKLKLQCGIQDQICAAHGGINYIQMTQYPNASVSQLQLPSQIWWELERRFLLIYLGDSHSSSQVHSMVIGGLEKVGPENPILRELRETASKAKNALLGGDLRELGRIMIENHDLQEELHPSLISQAAKAICEIAAYYNAWGWKVNGAGGEGGSLTILCDPDDNKKRNLISAVEAANPKFKNIPIHLAKEGLRVWEAI